MTPTQSEWNRFGDGASFTAPDQCARRSTRFERTVSRRNLVEYGAGILVIALFGSGAVASAVAGAWDFALSCLAVVAGTLFILWTLHRSGSNIARSPESDCRGHLLAQLAHQRDLLRRVPLWYLAPLVPGIAGIYGSTIARVAAKVGWERAFAGVWQPIVGTILFFIFVGALNLWAARRLGREIEALQTAG